MLRPLTSLTNCAVWGGTIWNAVRTDGAIAFVASPAEVSEFGGCGALLPHINFRTAIFANHSDLYWLKFNVPSSRTGKYPCRPVCHRLWVSVSRVSLIGKTLWNSLFAYVATTTISPLPTSFTWQGDNLIPLFARGCDNRTINKSPTCIFFVKIVLISILLHLTPCQGFFHITQRHIMLTNTLHQGI